MTNVTQTVRDYLNKHLYIVQGLNNGIINVRALSLQIIRQNELDVSLDAVMTGVRRYLKDNRKKDDSEKILKKIFEDSRISTKSRLVMIEVKRHFRLIKNIIPELLDRIHVSKGDVLRSVNGRESMAFIIDHSKLKEILPLIDKDELIKVTENLGEISLRFSEKYPDMPGIISPIISQLALEKINIILNLGNRSEEILIIDEKDISRCHDSLLRFFYGEK